MDTTRKLHVRHLTYFSHGRKHQRNSLSNFLGLSKINGGGYGQNIGYGLPIDKMITNAMYNGEMMKYQPLYGVSQPTDFEAWGHFSQIVWKKTTKVGCYTHTCAQLQDPNHGTPVPNVDYSVCNYNPPGRNTTFTVI